MPNALRQLSTFGNLFSSEVGGGQLIQTHDPRLIIVGFLETALYNFSGHYIYQAPLFLEGFVYGLADLLGVDAMDSSIIDPHDAFALNEPFEYSHDIAGNPVLAILGAAALVVFIWILKKRQRDKSDAYVAFAYISISIFMLLLRHTHYRTRYEILFFALLCPAIAIIGQRFLKKRETLRVAVIAILSFVTVCEILSMCIYHLEWAAKGNYGERPYGYFAYWGDEVYEDFSKLASMPQQYDCKQVGVVIEKWQREYPLLVMLGDMEWQEVNVDNETARYEDTSYVPDCLVVLAWNETEEEYISCHGKRYRIMWQTTDRCASYVFALAQ